MSSSSSQIQVRVLPEDIGNPEALRVAVNRQLRKQGKAPLDAEDEPRILRQSWDARRRPVQAQLLVDWGEKKAPPTWTWSKLSEDAPRVVVVGAGPAGLYAALECIQLGVRPVVLERGKDVRARRRDLAKLNKEHIVNPESNYCFGVESLLILRS